MLSSYEQSPLLELRHWSVYEVPLYGVDAPWTRHFVGYADEIGLAQISSAILMFDHDLGVGASASHRVFQLVGQSGRHQECTHLWTRWKLLNGIKQERDITPGFFTATNVLHGTVMV